MSGYGKKITDWYFGNNDREKETPKGGATRVLYLCWNYTGKLCLSGFLFLLCCIPVITIPAALCAQNAYLGKIFRNGYGFDLSDYWKEFKSSLWKHLPAGLLLGILGFYGYYLMSLAGNFTGSSIQSLLLGVGAGVIFVTLTVSGWYFIQASMLELSVRQLLQNAWILALTEWKRSLAFIAESLVFAGFMLLAVPFSLILLIPGMALYLLSAYAAIGPGIEKRVIQPFERGLRMSALQTKVRRCEDAYDKGDCEGQRSIRGHRLKYYQRKGKGQ